MIVGASLREPRLHRAQASHYPSMVHMLETVRARGYRRPGLLVRPDLEERMQRAYSAAFLAWENGGPDRIWRASWSDTGGLAAWLDETRPDVVIADTDIWRQALPAPGAVDFASMAVEDPAGDVSGHRQNISRVAEGAVDLLVQSRLRHETGVPAEPSLMLVSGYWVEGRTLRKRAQGATLAQV